MALDFYFKNDKLIMKWFPEWTWDASDLENAVKKKSEEGQRLLFKSCFSLITQNLILPDSPDYDEEACLYGSIEIVVGERNRGDKYFYLDKEVFGIGYDFAFDGDLTLNPRFFTKDSVSLIRLLSHTVKNDVFIEANGEDSPSSGHISVRDFRTIVNKMPTKSELTKYTYSVIQNLVDDFFDVLPDYKTKFERFIEKKRGKTYKETFSKSYYEYKIDEYKALYKELSNLLENDSTSESDWQNRIIDILCLIYPKYVVIIPKFEFKSLGKTKIPDFIAIDSDGDVDVIEIKKANIGPLLKKYRGNFVPRSELSGAIVQAEQYTYYLKSEKEITERYIKEKYPEKVGNLEINIINPQGIVIAGRNNKMNPKERKDFEVVKRMHKNISEILTYDDLLRRLKNLIHAFENKKANMSEAAD